MDFKTWKCPVCKNKILCTDYKEHSNECWKYLKQNSHMTCYDCLDEFDEYASGRKLRQLTRRSFKRHLITTHKKDFAKNKIDQRAEVIFENIDIDVEIKENTDRAIETSDIVFDREKDETDIPNSSEFSLNVEEVCVSDPLSNSLNKIKFHRSNDKEFILLDLLLNHYKIVNDNFMSDKSVKSSENIIIYTLCKYGLPLIRNTIGDFKKKCVSSIKPKINEIDLEFGVKECSTIKDNEIKNLQQSWISLILDKDDLSHKEGFNDYKKFLVRECKRAKLYCGDVQEILERNLSLFSIKLEEEEDVIDIDMFFGEFTIASICAPGITYKTMTNITLRLPIVYKKKNSKRSSVISFAVALSSFSKEDKHAGLIKEAISLIHKKKIILQQKERTLNLRALISDNGYFQYLLGTSGNFTPTGENVCRFCILKNRQFSEYYTCNSINSEELKRKDPLKLYLPLSLYWTADILHDLSLGVTAYCNYRTIGYLVKVFNYDVKILIAKLNSYLKKGEYKYTSVLKDDDILRKLKSVKNWSFIEKKNKFTLSGAQQNMLSISLERYLSEYIEEMKEKCNHSVVVKRMCYCKIFSELQFLHKNLNETYKYLISHNKGEENISIKIDNILKTIKLTTSDSYSFALKEHLLGHYPLMLEKKIDPAQTCSLIYESHNSYLKKVMQGSKNGINLAYSTIRKALIRDEIRLKIFKIENELESRLLINK